MNFQILHISKQDSLKENLDELFRFFHTYKASSAYLELTPITTLVSKTETILSSLRDNPESVSESIVEWLLKVLDQMYKYSYEMDTKETLPETPLKKLKSLSLIYVDPSQKRAEKIIPILKHYSHNVQHVADVTENLDALKLDKQHILICFLKDGDFALIDFIQQNYRYLPMIPIYKSIDYLNTRKLLKRGISHTVEAPISVKK